MNPMRMLCTPWIACCVAAVLAGGCAAGRNDVLYHEVQPELNFADYETFAFVTEADGSEPPEGVEGVLETTREAVQEELTALGLTEADSRQAPDLEVVTLAETVDAAALQWECAADWRWWGAWGFDWAPCGFFDALDDVEPTRGSLWVALVDPALEPPPDGEPVALAGLLLGAADGLGDTRARIRRGMRRLFRYYPVE